MYIYIYIPFLDKVDKVLGFHFEVSRGDGPSRFLQFLQTNDLQHWVSIMLKAPLSRRCMGMSKAMVFLERWSTRIAIEVLDPSRGVSGDESNHLKTFKSCHMLLDFGGLFMLSMVHKSQQLEFSQIFAMAGYGTCRLRLRFAQGDLEALAKTLRCLGLMCHWYLESSWIKFWISYHC